WPDCGPDLPTEIDEYHEKGLIGGLRSQVLVVDRGDGRLGGFIEASLRPIASGCRTSPVGYVEGWYVDEDLRRRGLGRALVDGAIDWAKRHGCREIASDYDFGNATSRAAHAALGFWPAAREVAVLRAAPDAAPSETVDAVGLMPFNLRSE